VGNASVKRYINGLACHVNEVTVSLCVASY